MLLGIILLNNTEYTTYISFQLNGYGEGYGV